MTLFKEKYQELLIEFFREIDGINIQGIPSIHIPAVGDLYSKSKYKIAFFGMETNGWGNLEDLRKDFFDSKSQAFESLQDNFRELSFLNWTNNFKTSFFNYVLLFLAKFYNISNWEMFKRDESIQYILKSFIWGNLNSLERYEVSAINNGASKEAWDVVKNASCIFDNASHILDTCKPNVVLVMHWNGSEKWLSKVDTSNKEIIGDHLEYMYSKNTDTHIYWLAHPRWIAINGGFNESIEKIIADLNVRNAHIPDKVIEDTNIKIEQEKILNKKEYIGSLASFLKSNGMKMSGYELAAHLNRNNFRTSYGTKYQGTRGTHKLIKDCYEYFAKNGNVTVASCIADSFTKENGEYAYN